MKTIYTIITAALMTMPARLLAQVPSHSSLPSAEAVLYLDYDGHVVNGTSFNYDGPIVCEPANLTAEQMTEVYNRIAEDYRPFQINVTTDSAAYAAAPATKRTRAVFTVSHSWYGNAAGGVALMNSFSWGDGTPCFVFTALFQYNAKQIAEAGAHEVGHTLGLSHQASYDINCGKTSEFNYGAGNGETGWAPIMGVGYYRNFTVWHNGSDPYGCNNTQNDLEIITSEDNGFGFRADDHGDQGATATVASVVQGGFNAAGVVATTNDVDLFRFTVTKNSQVILSALPYSVGSGNTGSDLDLQVDVLDSAQQLIGSYNPGNELSSIVDTLLLAGTYYLRIDGAGNEYAPEYGSLGSYSVQGTVTEIPLPLRKLEMRGTSHGPKHTLSWTIDADEAIQSMVLEVEEHGGAYRSLRTLSPQLSSTSVPSLPGVSVRYRLAVQFDNGKKHYSNIISLRSQQSAKPALLQNVVHSESVTVSSAAGFDYGIYEYSGRLLQKGRADKGVARINLTNMPKGFYILQYSTGGERFVEKFVKQ
ncbi:MAG TPA: T9SS type A sorting domain-containing protein [Flavisolibacter sp.]